MNVAEDRSMDSRCPRQLDKLPCEACPLAILRLKLLRNQSDELTEEEELNLPGCNFAIQHQLSNYCFFVYTKDFLNKPPLDKEIAYMNNISVDTVKQVEASAISKIKNMETIKDIVDE